MKKIVLLVNLFTTLLFSFSIKTNVKEEIKIETNLLSKTECSYYDALVTITTASNLIQASGVIIDEDFKHIYIATSYKNHDASYHYEIVFNDYSREKAEVVGYAIEDQVLVLKTQKDSVDYCVARLSKSEYIDVAEDVFIGGKDSYHTVILNTIVSTVGICKNCVEETFKNYYYSYLSESVSDNLIGAGVFDLKGGLLGMVVDHEESLRFGTRMLDVNKLYSISYNLINFGEYTKNYIKYNLLDVNSLTNHEKYLYSLDEGITNGVLVSSVHYLNYIIGGLNQGMVILKVNNVKVDNKYELDNELGKYLKGSKVTILIKTIHNTYRNYRIKL